MPLPTIPSGNVASALPSGYTIANSCRFNVGDDPKLSRTSPNSSPTNADKFTFSCWVKRSVLGARQQIYDTYNGSSGGQFQIYFKDDDTLRIQVWNSSSQAEFIPNRTFGDVSAWMNIIFAYDSTPSTPSSSSVKLFINGVQETSFATETYPSQNVDGEFAIQNHIQMIGNDNGNSRDCGLYLAEVVGVDGQALAHTSFGEFSEDSPTIWQPIDVSGINVGTLGFYLDFEDSSALGNDVSSVGDFTATNLVAGDQATDTPTNNFATLNPLWRSNFDNDGTFSEGNCKRSFTSDNSDRGYGFSTMGVTAGKWYWEIKIPTVARASMGVGDATAMAGFTQVYYDESTSKGMQVGNAGSINENNTSTAYASSLSDNDIVMFALDMDNHRCWYGINGTWQDSGDPTSGSTGTGDMTTQISDQTHINTGEFIFPFCFDASTSGQSDFEWNFGGCPAFSIASSNSDGNGYGSFEYSVPANFLALCSKNLGSDGG